MLKNVYKIEEIIWETTLGCNLRCIHCGSDCRTHADDELSADEALKVARQIAEVHPRNVSLTGGEPLLRTDIYDVIKQLSSDGIEVALITNGTLVTPSTAAMLSKSGVSMVAVSIDGLDKKHDDVRGSGVWEKVTQTLKNLAENTVPIGVITTLMKTNIGDLEDIYNYLLEHNVVSWQLQVALPEGRFANCRHLMPTAEDVKQIIDYSLTKNLEGKMRIYLADTIGYYTTAEVLSRMLATNSCKPVLFKGCNAGIRSVGILCNGDVVGCTSIRQPEYVEGNLRHQTLAEIWNNPKSFAWRRNLKPSDLGSKCQHCGYVDSCLGGCTNIRLTIGGKINSDNPLCVYSYCSSFNKK